jgi:multiple sugar transport system substrate-binding protein
MTVNIKKVSSIAATAAIALTALIGIQPAQAAGNISLRVTMWSSNAGHLALFNGLANEYKKTHPEIKEIKFDSLDFATYTQTLTTQIAGGKAPDLAWILEKDAQQFRKNRLLLNVGKEMAREPGYRLDEIAPGAIGLWKTASNVYAYPFSTSPFALFYNADLIKAAGAEDPEALRAKGAWTWEAARNVAAKVAAYQTGNYGLNYPTFNYTTWNSLAAFWRGFGAEAWSSSGKICTFNSKQMKSSMSFLHGMIYKDKSFPAPGVSSDFLAGNVGMSLIQLSRAAGLAKVPWKWGVVPLPKGPAVEAQVIGQAGFAVLAKSKNRKAAADFLVFATNPTNAAKYVEFFPQSRTPLMDPKVIASKSILNEAQAKLIVTDGISKGKIFTSHPNLSALELTVKTNLDALWKPDADVSGTLDALCTRISPILKG